MEKLIHPIIRCPKAIGGNCTSDSSGLITMVKLARSPKVIQLARDLGLSPRGDCLTQIRNHAIAKVLRTIEDSAIPVESLDTLRRLVANKYRARLEVISSDSDIERIATECSLFHPHLRKRLVEEFLEGTTEGITLERDPYDSVQLRYLVIVDSRGERAARAYFTAWHELTHLVVHPEQLRFPGFRRTPLRIEIEKDPLESVVDHVAGRLAFYRPLFEPAIQGAMKAHGGITFEAIDQARAAAAPSASLFATAIGSINFAPIPTLLVAVGLGLKIDERRLLCSPQQRFGFAEVQVSEKVRALTLVPNELVPKSRLTIRRNMRVPLESVLVEAFESDLDATLDAQENQSWWETSEEGKLGSLPLRVQAIRRGRFAYGLITPSVSIP